MINFRSPRSLVFVIRNLLWFLVRSEYARTRLVEFSFNATGLPDTIRHGKLNPRILE